MQYLKLSKKMYLINNNSYIIHNVTLHKSLDENFKNYFIAFDSNYKIF